jgi:hypothetical protein
MDTRNFGRKIHTYKTPMMLSPSALTAAATSGACSGGAPGFHQRNTRESRVKGITPGPLSAQPTTATIPGALRHSSAGFNRHRFPSAFAWCDLNRCQVCVARFHRRLFHYILLAKLGSSIGRDQRFLLKENWGKCDDKRHGYYSEVDHPAAFRLSTQTG